MMTGLYPAGHGVHENARALPATFPLVAERLHQAGYRTAAFVSSFVLARRFGLARGFDVYDDDFASAAPADATPRRRPSDRRGRRPTRPSRSSHRPATAAALPLGALQRSARALHTAGAVPQPIRENPYLGEVAAMDEQLGRLVQAFEQTRRVRRALIVVADHGEGLGDHGEAQHGTLLYQSTMHVPLVMAGPGVAPGVERRAGEHAARLLHDARLGRARRSEHSLRAGRACAKSVLGEAMKPFLEYGWQPQVMAVTGRFKAILAGRLETYDLAADPRRVAQSRRAASTLPGGVRKALSDYPVPSPEAARAPANLDEDARRRLASLGYVSATARRRSCARTRRGRPT